MAFILVQLENSHTHLAPLALQFELFQYVSAISFESEETYLAR